jgi:diacylglycerol kinase family enzyme
MVEVSHATSPAAPAGTALTISGRRRLLAVAALGLGPFGAIALVVGLAHGLPEVLLAAVAFVPAAPCAWIALGRRGLVRVVWTSAAVSFLLLALYLVWLSDREVLWVFVGAAAIFLAGSAGVAALHRVPVEGQVVRRRAERRPSRAVLFINPRSGGGTARRVDLATAAEARGIRVVELTAGDDLDALVRAAVADGSDCLGAAGGDGTLAQVAKVAIEQDLPFVCVPAGTRNHFALDLGLDRTDPIGALDAFNDADTFHVDVAEVNGRLFLNNVSIGVYGEVVADAQYRDHKVGTALAKLPELIGPEAESLDLRFVDDADGAHDSALVVLVSNNAYEFGPSRGFGSRPSLRDGQLGVVALSHGSGLLDPLRVRSWSTPTFRIDSSAPVSAGLDGESIVLDPPVEFRVRARALRVRIPLHAPGESPAAMRPRFGVPQVLRLVDVARGRVPG